MSMNYNIIVMGILAVLVFATAFMSINESSNTGAEKSSFCMTDEQFNAALAERFNPNLKDEIMFPTYLPEGYNFQCKNVDYLQAFLIYTKEPIPTTDFTELVYLHKAIMITINDKTNGGDTKPLPPEERITRITKFITPERMEAMKLRFLDINGYPAWGREAGDYGMLGIRYSNGTIVSINSTYEPARLEIAIVDLDYIIVADRPLDDLIAIAKSLK